MWRRVVLAFNLMFVFYNHVLPQPLTDSINNDRQSRQLDLGECCPCPTKGTGGSNYEAWPAPTVLEPSGRGVGFDPLTGRLDDCPCRSRSDDSEGSQSIFFPTSTRAKDPFIKQAESKEDPKNLLEPEVDFASSVLETLREATEEEYRDAVARDAARARAAEDATPEESARNVVTIIVSPKQSDDNGIMSEASHVQESRCIHPIGSSLSKVRSSATRPPNILTEIFKLPKAKSAGLLHRKQLDMDSSLGASNVHERVIADNRDMVKASMNPNDYEDTKNDDCDLRSSSILSKLEQLKQKNILDSTSYDRPSVPKIRINNQIKNSNRDNDRPSALNSASSNLDELISEKKSPRFSLRTLLPVVNNVESKRPVSLKNLLKLRDVELISPIEIIDKEKGKVREPIFPSLFNRNNKYRLSEATDLLGQGTTFKSNNDYKTSDDDDQTKELSVTETKAYVPLKNVAQTEILDTVPNTSNINKIRNNNCDIQKNYRRPPGTTIKDNLEKNLPTLKNSEFIETEILDTVPSPSENRPLVVDGGGKSSIHNDGGNSVMKNLSINKDTCNVFRNIKEMDLPEKEDEISNVSSDENRSVSNDEDQTIANSEDSEADSSSDVKSANKSCFENTDQNRDVVSESKSNDMLSDLKNFNTDLDTESTSENKKNPIEEFTRQVEYKEISNLQENEGSNLNSKNKLNTQNRDLLASTKNVAKKLEDLKKTSKLFKQKKELESRLLANRDQSDVECENDATENVETSTSVNLNTDLNESNKNLDHLSTEDLQKLSDSLLKKSTESEKLDSNLKEIECDEDPSVSKNGFNHKFGVLESLDDKTVAEQHFEKPSDIINNVFTRDNNLIKENNKQGSLKHTKKIEKTTKNILLSDVGNSRMTTVEENELKPLGGSRELNEMTAEASNPFTSAIYRDPLNLFEKTNLRFPLLQDIIVQPSSLFGEDINIFDKPILDIGSPFNLPSLDDIRERLANMFGIDAITAGDELTECADDSSLMSAEASNSNFQSKSPLKPLEDINLDIFQLKPLTMMKSNSFPDVPRLSLKSYKAKLPIPKNLDIKPMKLQSTLGNKGGLLGTILTVGPETKTTKKISEVLRKPLETLQNIEDMRAVMKTNAENILSSPLSLNSNTFDKTLRPILSVNSLSDNIRSHAESTIRDIQERMESTLQGVKMNDILGGQLNKPQDLLEKIADAREDFNDKLKGLHFDLNDRLTSLHDNILDQTRLMTLNNPALREKSENINIPYYKSSNRITQAPTLQRLTLENKKESHINKANSQRDPILGHFQTKNVIDQSKLKTFKMPTAASVPVPKSVEAPKLKLVPTKSSLSNLQKDLKIKDIFNNLGSRQAENTRVPNLQRPLKSLEEKRLLLRKQTNPFKDTKLKVTFVSTTASPISMFKSKELTTPRHIQKAKARTKESDVANVALPTSQLKLSDDPKGTASNMKSSRLEMPSAAFSAESKSPSIEDENINNEVKNKISPKSSNMNVFKERSDINVHRTPKVEVQNDSNFKSNGRQPNGIIKTAIDRKPPIGKPFLPLVWPKISENSFLSKVREAVQARLSPLDPGKARNANTDVDDKNYKMRCSSDMERSPSENSEVVVQEPLKENISYKCRMVCTRT